MLNSTALVLFESTDAPAVLADPVNADWLAVVDGIQGEPYDSLARRYYLALSHFRGSAERRPVPGRVEVEGDSRQEALRELLDSMNQRKASEKVAASKDEAAIFVDVSPDREDESLHEALRDFSKRPPAISDLLRGPGRPPCDALCLLRSYLGAPVVGAGDGPTEVHRLLHSNPTFARACGFLGRDALKQPGELTSRRLPTLSVCEEFNEVMARYGLWQLARIEQVKENLETDVVTTEDTLAFDTTHLEANSHCANVIPADAKAEGGKKVKHRKVPRVRKMCGCGKSEWETCEHAWTPTDQGAAVVVKGPTRIYWAHKVSVATFGDSEVPLDVRVLQYGAEHDGKTLVPHLELMQRDLPQVVAELRHVVADDAYKGNDAGVVEFGHGAKLTVPVHPSRSSKAKVADGFAGIDHFTPTGVPICDAGHRFDMIGRDLSRERYIWTAPDEENGRSVCIECDFRDDCLAKGTRRHIRTERGDFPQIDWDRPQHLATIKRLYDKRTGVERAIKRLKVDLKAAHLTQRDGHRVQAHVERKLLTIHILLKAIASG
jgi:hypothetical protein